ncbi:alpha/beta fold hydrolase [Pusillimonas noertemannii]|uniref:Proline iminopeptidase n=1 Tax=Pusillimonas noertemannii TaxID=305977 RepID=A0A2U1CIJ7_9BURK|nr:alpha/beta fold hydrolase [Pusillimonas noertemannii]NYT70364.1 alpha/beta fold hydrolase [Pusillimonas noertemannii]PVY60815.1 proline iminopeptidase [Pusillimonas noertemannii]TFL08580.1 alpha/beta fold hydrolase [Pusillimonas noertemannii]
MSTDTRHQASSSTVLYGPNRAGFAQLHPSIEPFDGGWLEEQDGHRVYWEASGNPQGEAVLLVHGGPGGAIWPRDRRFFDPRRYRIIAFDQRGCGRSTPSGELRANTTAHLINDMERLRIRLGVERWLLFGGSWGATLALAYAQAHPARVSKLVLRGVFLARSGELRWLYQGGAAHMHPQAWREFLRPIPEPQRSDVVARYAALLAGPRTAAALALARGWCAWEEALMVGASRAAVPEGLTRIDIVTAGSEADSAEGVEHAHDGNDVDAGDASLHSGGLGIWVAARIGAHYLAHGGFLPEGALLAGAARLGGMRGSIIQGRYDLVTPLATAWALHKAWPGSMLRVVEGAGHASDEPGITRALLESVDGSA